MIERKEIWRNNGLNPDDYTKAIGDAMQEYAEAYALTKNKELQDWKESAMQVMNAIDLQEIGKGIGVPWGEDVSSKVLPWIREVKTLLKKK